MGQTQEDLERFLQDIGASISSSRPIDHGIQHKIARGPDTAIVNIYSTGKTSAGGKASPLRTLLDGWRLPRADAGEAGGRALARGITAPVIDATPRVGIDEAGKGDYFGPLVVAGVRVLGAKAAQELREIGVRDSKLLTVGAARAMARRVLEKLGGENVRVVVLSPREYEARRAACGDNVNRLLGAVDVEIMGQLEADVELFVVDEFARAARSYIQPHLPKGAALDVRPRAEDDAAVAAASVLARARYLEELDGLSREVGFDLPRGATHVFGAACRVAEERGPEGLAEVAKTHFSITERVLELAGESGRRGKR